MSLQKFSLADKTALITGGGTGIGFGIAKAMTLAGASVIITGRRENVLQDAKNQLGPKCQYYVLDVLDRQSIPSFIDKIEASGVTIDILVNNAGIHLKKTAVETTDEQFDQVIQTNLLSVFSLTRECAKRMIQRKSGCILLIGSMAGLFGIDRVVAYGTSKTALSGLMNNLVPELSPHNVRINTIVPGWIESHMMLNAINADEQRKQKIMNRIAMGSFGKAEDIGNAAVFLSSEAARYITGVLLPVDGGAAINF